GLRLLVTFGLAVLSYHFVEKPIRAGLRLGTGRLRFAVAPVAVVLVIAAAALAVRPGGDDPWAALRGGDEASASDPSAAVDPVLDVLVISDRPGQGLVDAL